MDWWLHFPSTLKSTVTVNTALSAFSCSTTYYHHWQHYKGWFFFDIWRWSKRKSSLHRPANPHKFNMSLTISTAILKSHKQRFQSHNFQVQLLKRLSAQTHGIDELSSRSGDPISRFLKLTVRAFKRFFFWSLLSSSCNCLIRNLKNFLLAGLTS